MLDSLDAPTVRTWCRLALEALGQAREEIDALNVFPVPDGDTGTNLYLTVEAAAREVDRLFRDTPPQDPPALAEATRAMAHGALLGARGNSGTILAQFLRAISAALTPDPADAPALRKALRAAAAAGYEAVARPVEGTVLSVAAAAAEAAERAAERHGPHGDTLAATARAAHEGALVALARTPEQLDVLGRAGVVDAGGRGLLAVLGALADAVAGDTPMGPLALSGGSAVRLLAERPPVAHQGPAFEVIYLLDAADDAIPALREELEALGDSLVVVGGDGLWNVHVHTDDAGAAVEAGIAAGRPHRVRITHFGSARPATPAATAAAAAEAAAGTPPQGRRHRGVVTVVHGEGLAALCAEAGATLLTADPDSPPSSAELLAAVRRARAREVVLLLNDPELRAAAGVAADQLREEGVRVAVIPTRSPVQGLAALAVHEPGRGFDEDVVAMTSAAGATRYAELAVAEGESWTMAGVCQAGDVLGLIDGDVAVIGADPGGTATAVLDRMLASGGELVTLVLGDALPEGCGERLQAHLRSTHPVVDTVVYEGGRSAPLLLIGVE
ncbi:DAK2 domain-containing protein [Phaeacidiphilus oryzae]|uniref:DAK2 domain-containing protein n=1 Tax=Phaeacidiphilus oryzae TaxID=348818 RepID=UPI000564AD8C|nr:DAK2 domain-containing protein [Phaeacidiphilus oryzae]